MVHQRAGEDRMRLLVDSIADYGIFLLEPDGTIATWNVGAERLKGYTAAEAIGQHFSIFYTEEQRAADHPARELEAAIATGRYEEEAWRVRKDGSLFWANVIITASFEDGVLRGFSKVTRDMTERKAFEAQVGRARDLALEAARARQEFLANMSHEIRTPMNAVIGMTSLLLDTELDHDQRDFVETIRSSGEHLLTVINDILDYSKIDAGKLVLEELPFSVREWVDASLDLVASQAQDKGLELLCDVHPDVPAVVVGDPARLRQVLVNLLSNAVKFTDAGEVVVHMGLLELVDDVVHLQVAVSDTGVGLDEKLAPALFDPFIQADSTTTRVYGGTGLGLAISRQLVERMDGAIALASVVGEGTTVTFSFRCGRSEAGEVTAADDLFGKRLLVVDDNATNRRIVESWVLRHGAICVCVASGAEALELVARDHRFDIAVLDLMMPEMDGAELGRRLRVALPHTPLVLLSSAGPYAREVSTRDTFAALLSKPVKREQLIQVLSTITQPQVGAQDELVVERSAFDLPGVSRDVSVLVVEDTPVNQKVARHLLARFGFRADVAASGLEALAALEQRGYDLILMDVQMPDMDGLEATREIRRRWPDRPVRIVAMTANVASEDVRQCLAAGMDGFLGKPIDVQELASVLAGVKPRVDVAADDARAVSPTLVDAAIVSRLRGQIGLDNVRELASLYLHDLRDAVPQLERGWGDRDRALLGGTAHKLKSGSRALGAVGIGEVFQLIEEEAATADWDRLLDLVSLAREQQPITEEQLTGELAAT